MVHSRRLPLSPLGALIAVIVGLLVAVIVVGLVQGILDVTVIASGLIGLLATGVLTTRGHGSDSHRDDRGRRDHD